MQQNTIQITSNKRLTEFIEPNPAIKQSIKPKINFKNRFEAVSKKKKHRKKRQKRKKANE